MPNGKMLREVEEEVTNLLVDLLRINTTNPPGKEIRAAQYLARVLKNEGFKCEVFESAYGRGNVVARIRGTGEGPSLLLLSHLDVVPANAREWTVDPFGGVVKDGFVWGRGALDMKSMTAIEVVVMNLLKRNNVKLKGDVILAATADEEKGGMAGAGWLVRTRPDAVRADYVINEGGGLAVPVEGRNIYTVQTAEKGILWFKVRAKGMAGHGSIPGAADNAILRMDKVLQRIANYCPEPVLLPTVKKYVAEIAKENKVARQALMSLLENPAVADKALDQLAVKDRFLAENIRAMMKTTITPTVIHGGAKENVIPSECEAVFDCRVLPGQSPMEIMAEIIDMLKDLGLEKLEFETVQANEPSESVADTRLYSLMVDVVKNFDKGCSVVPTMLTGGTDSRFFRRMGSVCYGFQPMRADLPYGEMLRTIHGVDERISVENLVFGTSVLYNVVERFTTETQDDR